MEDQKRRKGPGCCGIIVLVLLIGIAWLVAVRFDVPERLGLREPAAERVFAPPPDREASAVLMEEMRASGMNTEGVEFWVLPMADGGSAAILTMDASQGFDPQSFFDGGDGWHAFRDGSDDRIFSDLGVTRIGFDYRDESGRSIANLTVSADVLEQYSNDQMTEDEFVGEVMGVIDFPALTQGVLR